MNRNISILISETIHIYELIPATTIPLVVAGFFIYDIKMFVCLSDKKSILEYGVINIL